MNKKLTYTGFIISSLLIIFIFITAESYIQLAIAVILYPLLAYFAIKLFPRRIQTTVSSIPSPIPVQRAPVFTSMPSSVQPQDKGQVEIVDIDKRTFLKLIGTAGISFFIFSLLGRRAEDFIFNKTLPSLKNSGILSQPETSQGGNITEGYRIAEIDDNIVSYYGFTNKEGAWLIMREDSENNSFRYVKGKSNFSRNWANRENLSYDYYYNLFEEN